MEIGYKTTYLLLASFLVTRNEYLAEIVPADRRVVFGFEDSPTLKHNVTSFFRNGDVGITDFVAAFRNVKDQLRQALENERNHPRDSYGENQQAQDSQRDNSHNPAGV